MSYELFVIDRKTELDGAEHTHLDYLRDKLATAKFLGLDAQSASIKIEIETIERGRLITTPPLTDAELTIWRAWLPKVYTDIVGDANQLAKYNFDRIPKPVLKLWQKHKESGAFERFEIWTPENDQPDPILIGVNGNTMHLLARWGESDVNLVTFDDIKRELVRRWYTNQWIDNMPTDENSKRDFGYGFAGMVSVISAAAIFILLPVVLAHQFNMGTIGIVVGILLAIIMFPITFQYVRDYMYDKLRPSSPLMQAIDKDDSVQRELFREST